MRFGSLGLQGKFVVALLVAAALPFLVGLVVFESKGYQHLLEERGKRHQMEALTLVRALDQASTAQGEILRTWLAAEPALTGFIAERNRLSADRNREEIAIETRRLDDLWTSLPANDPRLVEVLQNPGSASLEKYRRLHPEVAEILATDLFGRLAAATGKASDFDQADETWWQKGIALADGGQWTDVLKFDASSGVFSLDVIVPLHDGKAVAGVAKMAGPAPPNVRFHPPESQAPRRPPASHPQNHPPLDAHARRTRRSKDGRHRRNGPARTCAECVRAFLVAAG